jgi:hypothetical protein
MKADAHHRHAESLERAIALARPDPTTSVPAPLATRQSFQGVLEDKGVTL